MAMMMAAPAVRATAAAKSPVGPQPVIKIVCPVRSSTKAASTALPSGSWRQASSGGRAGEVFQSTASGKSDILRERPVAIDAEDAVILAHMRLSGTTLEALTTCDVRLGGDIIAHFDERDIRADLHDFAAHFMANDTRRVDAAMRPGIPIVNMGICPAERGGCDADDGVGRARFRIRPVGGG